jgi:hypothetical protein
VLLQIDTEKAMLDQKKCESVQKTSYKETKRYAASLQ